MNRRRDGAGGRTFDQHQPRLDPVFEMGRDSDAREIHKTSRRGLNTTLYLLLGLNLLVLIIIAAAVIVGVVFLATKHHEISVMYDTVVRADRSLKALEGAQSTLTYAVGSRYNMTTMLQHIFPAKQGELERNIGVITSGARDLMGLISEVRGSDAIERFARLAYTLEKTVGNEQVQKSVPRILRTIADGLENTTKDDVRSFIEAMDVSQVKDILDVGNEIVGKLQSIVESLLRSGADQGMVYAMQRLVELAKDEEFRGMMKETPVLFHHLVEILESDEFKLFMSAGAQTMDRAETILNEAKEADLVGRGDSILTKADIVMDKIIIVTQAVEEDGINIQVGGHPRVRALPAAA